jgi:hypothetical protein
MLIIPPSQPANVADSGPHRGNRCATPHAVAVARRKAAADVACSQL